MIRLVETSEKNCSHAFTGQAWACFSEINFLEENCTKPPFKAQSQTLLTFAEFLCRGGLACPRNIFTRQLLGLTHLTRRPCWRKTNLFRIIFIKIKFSSQRRRRLFFLPTNMATMTSQTNQQLTCKTSIITRCPSFKCPPLVFYRPQSSLLAFLRKR